MCPVLTHIVTHASDLSSARGLGLSRGSNSRSPEERLNSGIGASPGAAGCLPPRLLPWGLIELSYQQISHQGPSLTLSQKEGSGTTNFEQQDAGAVPGGGMKGTCNLRSPSPLRPAGAALTLGKLFD
ncbi:hypothetical protein AAFF_G00107840 [Aldrovandia affinis]|uniref:Uncharacterized protein n=1 Tax=Aldrovandia affinis TaxID=143900 RepID=A0AAD7WBE3_9TELE|nr:hypothetical protein AAFF_G00107840 [Aldrovandia affinis]